jgi:predicted metal-dependent hydrolase
MSLLASASSLLKAPTQVLPFEYHLVRSARRRSISIEISKGLVTVRAPFFVAKVEIEKFVQSKAQWVQQKCEQQLVQVEIIPERVYETGSLIPFLGSPLMLHVAQATQSNVVQIGGDLWVSLSSRSRLPHEEQTRRLVSAWYQQHALKLLTYKSDVLVACLGLKHSGITVKMTRSKWGHCTARGAIQYNWNILLAPEPIVDYLIAHEVSHLVHQNHSQKFWQFVAQICPDYKKCRAWLKANASQLVL